MSMEWGTRRKLDLAEREVRWLAWPTEPGQTPQVYGPGVTADEVACRHATFLRSGWTRTGSGSYHQVRLAPETLPAEPWPTVYPRVRPGVDPWIGRSLEQGA
jgi:hypothetical protein